MYIIRHSFSMDETHFNVVPGSVSDQKGFYYNTDHAMDEAYILVVNEDVLKKFMEDQGIKLLKTDVGDTEINCRTLSQEAVEKIFRAFCDLGEE